MWIWKTPTFLETGWVTSMWKGTREQRQKVYGSPTPVVASDQQLVLFADGELSTSPSHISFEVSAPWFPNCYSPICITKPFMNSFINCVAFPQRTKVVHNNQMKQQFTKERLVAKYLAGASASTCAPELSPSPGIENLCSSATFVAELQLPSAFKKGCPNSLMQEIKDGFSGTLKGWKIAFANLVSSRCSGMQLPSSPACMALCCWGWWESKRFRRPQVGEDWAGGYTPAAEMSGEPGLFALHSAPACPLPKGHGGRGTSLPKLPAGLDDAAFYCQCTQVCPRIWDGAKEFLWTTPASPLPWFQVDGWPGGGQAEDRYPL